MSVCLLTGRCHVTNTHETLDLNVKGPSPCTWPYSPSVQGSVPSVQGPTPCTVSQYPPVQDSGPASSVSYIWCPRDVGLFSLVYLSTSLHSPHPTSDYIWWLANEARTMGKRAVRILPECFLVNIYDVVLPLIQCWI